MVRGETHAPTLVRRPFSFRPTHNSSVKKTPKLLAVLTGFGLLATSINDRLFAATV
jgi:hypothetical protein